MSAFSQLVRYWRFTRGINRFLKEPLTLEQSKAIIRKNLNDREKNLLAVVKKTIYDNQNSPFLKLLKLAGCEFVTG